MKLGNFLLFLLIVETCRGSSNESVLQLLVVLNVEGGPGVPRWDRGLEILPAAQLAVDKINGDPSILPGYNLELIQVDTGKCMHNFHSEGLINFVHQITLEENHIVGVVGLFCTSVAQLLSPLAGHQGVGLLQISGSASPVLRNQERHPYLWHMIPSSAVYVDAVLEMMEAFEWRNIAVIGAPGGLYYHTAKEFTLKVSGNDSRLVTLLISGGQLSSALRDLRQSRKRIVFASVEAKVAAQMICLAYQEGLVWPNYTWIFPDHHIEDFLFHADDMCDVDVLRRGLERVCLLRFHDNSSDLHTKYNTSTILTPNIYANAMHDSIQAFALSLNATVDRLQAMHLSLEDYCLGNSNITDMIERELMTLSFTGALGHVQFDANKRERQTTVDILQIRNGTTTQVGSYNPVTGQIVLDQEIDPIQDVNEILRIKKNSVPIPVTVMLLIVTGVCIIFTTIMLVLFIYYRRSAEIKATSFNLSLLMFVGCYLLFFSTLFHTASDLIDYNGPFFCNIVTWCASLGSNFVYGTMLVRMLRAYRIFSYFRRMGRKRWSDVFLCFVVLAIVGVDAFLLLIWALVDVFTIQEAETNQATASPPYIEVVLYCYSEHLRIWLSLVLAEVGILIFVVAFLAFKTRKIRQKHFKDTKKVNIYLFMNILLICEIFPLWWVLRELNYSASSVISLYVGYAGSAALCQLLLFAPKVMPPLIRQLFHSTQKEKVSETRTNSSSERTGTATTITKLIYIH